MSKYKVRNLKELYLWLEVEITVLHIGFYILLGILLGNLIGWIVCSVLIFISFLFAAKKMALLTIENERSE